MRERERERKRERERERETFHRADHKCDSPFGAVDDQRLVAGAGTDTIRDRQTDRQAGRQTGRQADRQAGRHLRGAAQHGCATLLSQLCDTPAAIWGRGGKTDR